MGRRIIFLLVIAAFVFSFTGTAYASVSDATPSQTAAATSLTFIISCIFIIAGVALFMRSDGKDILGWLIVLAAVAAAITVHILIGACFLIAACVMLAVRSGYNEKFGWSLFLVTAIAAAAVRIYIAAVHPGYAIDMGCFRAWAEAMHSHGPTGFYGSLSFADYPPGYMYILWAVSSLRDLLGFDVNSAANTVLVKLPAIISEIIIAAIVYKIASKESGKRFGLFCSFLILFNPALFFNSSVWGQIDPVFALFIVLSLYWLKKENYLAGAFFFAVALLVKPQAIMFAPVIGLAFVYSLFKRGGLKKALIGISGGLVIVAGVLFLGSLPFMGYQPQTPFTMENKGDEFIIGFGDPEHPEIVEPYEIKYVKYYASGEGSFSLSCVDEYGESDVRVKPTGSGEEAPFEAQLSTADPQWQQAEVEEFTAPYVNIYVDTPGVNIYEMAFYDGKGKAAPVSSVTPVNPGNGTPQNMFDEQKHASVQGYNTVYWIINKYTGTVGSYPYATLNAFNLFALSGGNWVRDTTPLLEGNWARDLNYKTLGMIFLVIICAAVAFIQWRTRERRPYFDISAFLIISLFMLMHMVHERYIVPACVLLVFAYAYSKDKSALVFAGLWSVSAMFNQMVVLYAETSAAPQGPLMMLSAINVALYAVYAVITIRKLLSGKVIIKSPALHG